MSFAIKAASSAQTLQIFSVLKYLVYPTTVLGLSLDTNYYAIQSQCVDRSTQMKEESQQAADDWNSIPKDVTGIRTDVSTIHSALMRADSQGLCGSEEGR